MYLPANTAGWLGSDVGKTVTSPGKPSYLITKVLDNTHAWASPTMDIKSSFTVYQGHWHMYHFGVNQTQVCDLLENSVEFIQFLFSSVWFSLIHYSAFLAAKAM